MKENGKIDVLKEAAKRVINTSTVGDRIAVIPFNDVAKQITDKGYVYIATKENKESLIAQIDALSVIGGTNFYDAFTAAFDVLDRSIADEAIVNCNTAILFLTDGKMTLPKDVEDQDVIDLVQRRLNVTSQSLDEPIYFFTYSLSGGDPEIDEFPKRLACSTGTGVWSKIEYEEDIVESLSNYYKFFALGLGSGPNEDFTAWVEPYVYIPGDTVGTTVSAPVYDRTKEPHLFLGVVGIDFTLDALDAALGITSSDSNESFQRVVRRATARCPRLQLSTCELESYRRQSTVGDEALCTNACAEQDFVQIEEEKCPGVSDYPRDLWINRDNEFISFLDTACCRVGETVPDNTCFAPPDEGDGTPIAAIAGAAAGGGVLLIALIGFVLYSRKKKRAGKNNKKIEAVDTTSNDYPDPTAHGTDTQGTDTQTQGIDTQGTPSTLETETLDSPTFVPNALPVHRSAQNLDYKDQCRMVEPRPFDEDIASPIVTGTPIPDPGGDPSAVSENTSSTGERNREDPAGWRIAVEL